MQFKAAVLEELGKPLVLRTLEMPETLYVGHVAVKIEFSGICGKQLVEQSGILGNDPYLPHCMGHEASGVVTATGPGVKHVRIGDHVVMHWRKGNGIESTAPQYWCPELGRYIGAGPVSTFMEYSVVSENRLTKISKDIPLEIAALFGCAVTTGLGLVSNEAQIKMGESVAVLGCGGVGLNVIQGCKLASAYPIIGIDLLDSKLQQASRIGATHTDRILIAKNIDTIIDTTGIPSLIESAWSHLTPNGRLFMVAQSKLGQQVSFNAMDIHRGRTVRSSDGGGTDPAKDIPRYLKLYTNGMLNLSTLITHCWSLSLINEALDTVRTGSVGRGILVM